MSALKTLVFFGAGASFGSGDVLPYPPPLGNDLFTKLEEMGGVAARLPSDIRHTFRANFEAGMAEFYAYSRGETAALQRQMAEYLAHFRPRLSNEYCGMLRLFGNSDVVYSTLNYDLLFELCCGLEGFSCDYSLLRDPHHVNLLKPHGSCNVWPNVPAGTFRGVTFRNNVTDISAPVIVLDQEQTIRRCREDEGGAPAMALYAEGKSVKVCPSFVQEQQELWLTTVMDAEEIIIIGVRVHPSDTHIWNPLATAAGKIFYFGRERSAAEFNEWRIAVDRRHDEAIEGDFERAVDWLAAR